ncbi:ATP-binding protein [Runella sp. SP2]|uniref:hybrid sensor histidine kinase/response regulator transcription factor n=1 Tax=Runella sp. SP2 TaxID=2268026 RepID=UPI000F0782C4|nr:ATP-binding protein [Runella sp. SP2]AYQ30943.1 response regulator [Runella sp. SP2]
MPTLSPFKNKRLAASILFILLFLGSSSATPLNAQSPKIASFLKLKDLARLDSLEMHFIWANEEPDSASMAADLNAIELYANQSQDKALRIFNNYLTLRYFTFKPVPKPSSKYLEMKKLLDELAKLPQTLLTDRIRAYIEFRMGIILYDDRANSVTLVNHFLTADLFFRKIGYDNVLLADHKLNRLGTYYMNQVSDFKTAIKYFREGEKYLAKDPIDRYRIEFYKNYANCLVYLKQYSQAIKYNKLAIAQVRLRRDSLKIGTINGNIGEIILNTSPNPAQSEPYFKQELVYRQRYKPKGLGDIAKAYGNLCQVAGVKGNKADVARYFDKAIFTLNSDPDKRDYHALVASLYNNRMIADSLIGDFKSAYYHRKRYYEELIVSNEQEIKAITSEASVRFDVEKNKLQAELANEQAQNARFWILAVSLVLAIVLFGAYFVYYRQKTRREELMRRLSFEQKEAERLMALDETKTRFFTNISHEFRTPLTLLVGPLAELGKKYPTEGMIPIMQRNLSRLQNLINQLLDLSKLEVGKLEPIIQYGDVAHFLRYQFASFESLAQSKQIIFERTQSHQKCLAYFDEDKLEKIVTNLLSNAFKFTNENGRVKVNVQYTTPEGEGNEKGALLTLTVADNGIGIDAERLHRIFDRFYQIDDSQRRHYEGTGIGLALVKELVLALRGTIDVTSKPEKGTTFVVTLPCDAAHWSEFVHASQTTVEKLGAPMVFESSVSSSIEAPVVDKNSEAPLLLIVEDNPDLRHYIRSIFSSTYRIEEAQDGQIGLQMATELIPDVVICDVMMPRLDGFGFCKALKTDIRTNHIPVVMLTAKATLNDRLEGLEIGADDYLSKPFYTEELQVRIQNLLKKQQLLQQKYAHLAPVAQVADEVVPAASMDDLFLQKVTDVLAKNYTESSFDVDQFAAAMGLTSVQLRRKLKALTNQTVTEYVRNYRLQIAADMLQTNAGTVSEIAYKVGFESLPYFSKVFSERYGISPSEYA